MGPAARNPELWERQARNWTTHRIARAGVRLFLCAAIWFAAAVCQQRLWSGQEQTSANHTRTDQRQKKAEFNAHPQQMPASDREITGKVHRAILKDKSLSPYAHHVKVITQNGNVGLQGPVRSQQEKAAVEAKAAEIVGADKVQSEISIIPKRTNPEPSPFDN